MTTNVVIMLFHFMQNVSIQEKGAEFIKESKLFELLINPWICDELTVEQREHLMSIISMAAHSDRSGRK